MRLVTLFALTATMPAVAQSPELDLPDLLVTQAGVSVESAEAWRDVRRPELLELFRTQVYGRAPIGRPADQSFAIDEVDPEAMGGAATRKAVCIRYSGPGGERGCCGSRCSFRTAATAPRRDSC